MSGSGCRDYRSSIGRRAFLGSGLAAGAGLGIGSLGVASDGVINLDGVPRDTAVIQYWLNGAASHFETYEYTKHFTINVHTNIRSNNFTTI